MRAVWLVFLLLAACGAPAPAAPVENTAPAPAVDPPPYAVVLVIDRSGSMMGAKMESARASASRVAAGLPAAAEFALIAFDSAPEVLVPLTRAGERDAIAGGIARLEPAGGTVFVTALATARDLLAGSPAARKLVVFFSDGEAAYDGVEDATRALVAGGATVSTVAMPGADQNLLALIADAGGGRMVVVDDVAGLAAAVDDELRRLTAN